MADQENNNQVNQQQLPALKLFGQEFYYPATVSGATTACTLFLSICLALAIVYIWSNKDARNHVETLVYGTHFRADGSIETSQIINQIQFWTPSLNTFKNIDPSKITTDIKWEIASDSTQGKLDGFEKALDDFATGWRRNDVVGKGRTEKKDGYWWVITIKPGFNEAKFVKKYAEIWGNTSPVYIESQSVNKKYDTIDPNPEKK